MSGKVPGDCKNTPKRGTATGVRAILKKSGFKLQNYSRKDMMSRADFKEHRPQDPGIR